MGIVQRYDLAAPIYDRAAWILSLGGIDKLHPELVRGIDMAGKTVVDLGCGTGLAFPQLVAAVGVEGRVIGVDSNAAILEKARKRVDKNGWNNVDLVVSDMINFDGLESANIVLSCIAISCVDRPAESLSNLVDSLSPGTQVRIIDALPNDGGVRGELVNLYNFGKSKIVGSHYRQLGGFERMFSDRLRNVSVDHIHGGMYTKLTGEK